MNRMILQIGQVFEKKFPQPQLPGLNMEWNVQNIRIIMFDDEYVYYEPFSLDNGLGFFTENLLSKAAYYRIGVNFFNMDSKFLANVPITDQQKLILRPDLPIELFPVGLNFKWSLKIFDRIESFVTYLGLDCVNLTRVSAINSSKIVIYPFGRSFGLSKPVIIEAINKVAFEPIELLWRLNNIQATSIKKDEFEFCGVYRRGHENGLPAYTIKR